MDEDMVGDTARALGRIEANQEAAKSRHEDIARTVNTVRESLHSLRNDLTNFVAEQRDHARRITQLEALPLSRVADFGDRLKAIEDDAELVAEYMAREDGIRGFVKWTFTAGCGFVGAAAAFLGILWARGH